MGIFSSKLDVGAIEAIESNVVSLIVRLGEEETKMKRYVKIRLIHSLIVYSVWIEKQDKKGYLSKRKISKMKDLIVQAKEKVENLATCTQADVNTNIDIDGAKFKNNVSETEQLINERNLTRDLCEFRLKELTYAAEILDANNRLPMNEEENNNLSVLFLKLFLNSPVTSISKILKHTQQILDNVIKNFALFNIKDVNGFHAEEVSERLKRINSQLEIANNFTTMGIHELEKQSSSTIEGSEDDSRTVPQLSTVENKTALEGNHFESCLENQFLVSKFGRILQQIHEDIRVYEKITEKFCPPITDAVVNQVYKKVVNLINHLRNMPGENKKIMLDRSLALLKNILKINEENKEVAQSLEILKKAEDNSITTTQSSASFQEKRKSLETIYEMVSRVSTNNTEVTIQKTEVVNRLEGLTLAETLNYLRQLKKTVDYYRSYVQQFVYPKTVPVYKIKCEEISLLKETINEIPIDKECIHKRKHLLQQELNEVYDIFSEKVKHNEDVILAWEYLDDVADDALTYVKASAPRSYKLQQFNIIRTRIASVDGFHQRLSNKKSEILNQLHGFEENIYADKYPREIQEAKCFLNKYEKDAHEFVFPSQSEEFIQREKEMMMLWKKMSTLSSKYDICGDSVDIFRENFNSVHAVLTQTSKEVRNNNNCIEKLEDLKRRVVDLSTKNLTLSEKLEQLQQHEDYFNALIKRFAKNVSVLPATDQVGTLIKIEKSKIEISELYVNFQKLKKDMNQLSHPIDTNIFLSRLSHLCFLYECVEDMPKGNAELDSRKQDFLNQVAKILRFLDEQVAYVLVNRKQVENILQLNSHFNESNFGTVDVEKESVEFVQLIRQRAEYFENHVRNYLGRSHSVEYYVIHENLMRLMEELDKLSCGDEIILNATIETITYIKNLMEQLKSNASN